MNGDFYLTRFAPFSLGRFPYLLLSEVQIVGVLQIQPKLGACAKEMSQEQGGFALDGARTVQGFRIFAYFSFVSSTTMTSIG